MNVFDGIICNSSVQVRRMVFYNYAPYTLTMTELKILPYDDYLIDTMDNQTLHNYLLDISAYTVASFRPKLDPDMAWAMPYVTGHKYKVHW